MYRAKKLTFQPGCVYCETSLLYIYYVIRKREGGSTKILHLDYRLQGEFAVVICHLWNCIQRISCQKHGHQLKRSNALHNNHSYLKKSWPLNHQLHPPNHNPTIQSPLRWTTTNHDQANLTTSTYLVKTQILFVLSEDMEFDNNWHLSNINK